MSAEEERDGISTEGTERNARAGRIEPDSAFELLGNETRMAVLDALRDTDANWTTFSELHDAAGTGSSAGFAYHLEKLLDHYIEKSPAGYRLTSAGRRVVRAVVAGTYTERVAADAIEVTEPCPVCGEPTLAARCVDNVLAVECERLDRPVATLSLPPGSHRREVGEELLHVANRHHRYEMALVADGICPVCAGSIEATLHRVPVPIPSDVASESDGSRAHIEFVCADCDHRLGSPVAFAVVEHPAIIGFFETHGIDVRERPLWNLGEEWSETTLSTEPWCVRVSVRLDGDRLDVLVGEGPTIHVLGQSRTAPNAS